MSTCKIIALHLAFELRLIYYIFNFFKRKRQGENVFIVNIDQGDSVLKSFTSLINKEDAEQN